MTINSINDIVELTMVGFSDWKSHGDIVVSSSGNLRIFCYATKAQMAGRWNFGGRGSSVNFDIFEYPLSG